MKDQPMIKKHDVRNFSNGAIQNRRTEKMVGIPEALVFAFSCFLLATVLFGFFIMLHS